MIATHILTASVFGGAYLFQSVFGFGASFIAVLVASLFLPMQSAVVMVPFTILIACIITVLSELRSVRWRSILVLFAQGGPGVVVGGILLPYLPEGIITVTAAVLILGYGLCELSGREVAIHPAFDLPAAILAGVVAAVAGLGILFVPLAMKRVTDPGELRISLNFLWICLGVLRVPLYIFGGLVSETVIEMSLVSIPAILIALVLGRLIYRRLRPGEFKRGLLIFLTLLAFGRLVLVVVSIFTAA